MGSNLWTPNLYNVHPSIYHYQPELYEIKQGDACSRAGAIDDWLQCVLCLVEEVGFMDDEGFYFDIIMFSLWFGCCLLRTFQRTKVFFRLCQGELVESASYASDVGFRLVAIWSSFGRVPQNRDHVAIH